MFYGRTVLETDTLVKYTYVGDFNLDGVVDDNDLGTIINFYNQDEFGNTLDTPGGFAYGDTNYDSVINDDDLGNFFNMYPSADLGLPPLNVGQFDVPLVASAPHGVSVQPIPEPSTIVLLVMGLGFVASVFARKRYVS
jgi:hypothetical protein